MLHSCRRLVALGTQPSRPPHVWAGAHGRAPLRTRAPPDAASDRRLNSSTLLEIPLLLFPEISFPRELTYCFGFWAGDLYSNSRPRLCPPSKGKKKVTVFVWTCHKCGHNPISIKTGACPKCSHSRCQNCSTEKVTK
ncbi:hypothetical protein CLAIMM_09360 [Cladophialophora immunda]|nr:hypothetical protein CLAIMM_09360 [Cladophialophora immunda]